MATGSHAGSFAGGFAKSLIEMYKLYLMQQHYEALNKHYKAQEELWANRGLGKNKRLCTPANRSCTPSYSATPVSRTSSWRTMRRSAVGTPPPSAPIVDTAPMAARRATAPPASPIHPAAQRVAAPLLRAANPPPAPPHLTAPPPAGMWISSTPALGACPSSCGIFGTNLIRLRHEPTFSSLDN
jgi:hypothetical protein